MFSSIDIGFDDMLNKKVHRRYIIFNYVLWIGMLSGCATTFDQRDPYEKFNRHVFKFNQDVDKILLRPVAETYQTLVPAPIDKGISNFFSNINEIVVVTNDLLQFKFKQALFDAGRFFINTSMGVLGLFDVANENGLVKHDEDFGQTLGYWGFDHGPYLVLPFFGPSSMRDALGRSMDTFLDPRVYYATSERRDVQDFVISTNVLRAIDVRADLLGVEEILDTAALDSYTYVRDAYLQRREYLIYDGHPPKQETFDEEDLFDDVEKKTPAGQ